MTDVLYGIDNGGPQLPQMQPELPTICQRFAVLKINVVLKE